MSKINHRVTQTVRFLTDTGDEFEIKDHPEKNISVSIRTNKPTMTIYVNTPLACDFQIAHNGDWINVKARYGNES